MKLVFTVLSLYFGVYCHGSENKCHGDYLRTILYNCILANGGDFEHLNDLLENKLAHSDNGKCFRGCVMLQCGYYNYDGTISDEVAGKLAHILHGGEYSHIKLIEEVGSKCVALQIYDNSLCNTSEEFIRCMIENSPVELKLFGVFD